MSDGEDRPANPETPWEFLSEDEQRRPMPPSAEDAAMHVIGFGNDDDEDDGEEKVVVHYLEDEHPEIPDPTEPVEDIEHTATVQDLLIRQHYLPADEADSS